ncbi:MAG: cellulase family glycosylhydrolase [Planctomycetales bacterium]|nr:cellulase family glycosylhydrolase [Planctomycetales bacterium]
MRVRILWPYVLILICANSIAFADQLEWIRASDNGTHFVKSQSGSRFVVWGVNYDHDSAGRLLDEYWHQQWDTVVEDFHEIKELGANCVRIHLQFGKFMNGANAPNKLACDRLAKLVKLAEQTELYLDVTGLACYHKQNVPDWYNKLAEPERWKAQAAFWQAVANSCKDSPAIFCYDLMNEPILPGDEPATDWLAGEFGGKYFVQRLTLDLNGRTRETVAQQWVETMTTAIRQHDKRHMITVGTIPWVFVFGGGRPLFHSENVGKQLDFVSVHFYPKKGEIDKAIQALKAYDIGKPLVVEETFPLACSEDELVGFIKESASITDGWISFYWGTPAEVLQTKPNSTIGDAITASWLKRFKELGASDELTVSKSD